MLQTYKYAKYNTIFLTEHLFHLNVTINVINILVFTFKIESQTPTVISLEKIHLHDAIKELIQCHTNGKIYSRKPYLDLKIIVAEPFYVMILLKKSAQRLYALFKFKCRFLFKYGLQNKSNRLLRKVEIGCSFWDMCIEK